VNILKRFEMRTTFRRMMMNLLKYFRENNEEKLQAVNKCQTMIEERDNIEFGILRLMKKADIVEEKLKLMN